MPSIIATPHRTPTRSPVGTRRAALASFAWAIAFIALHGYWALGGRFGIGEQDDPIPLTTDSLVGWVSTVVVALMFLGGLLVPLALVRPWGYHVPRRLLLTFAWIGAAVLAARGVSGLVDDLVRALGVDGGITGLSYKQTLGTAHPSAYTVWSAAAIDALFLVGGLLFGAAAVFGRPTRAR